MKKKGFTLIELMATMGIMGIVVAMMGMIFNYGLQLNKTQEAQVYLNMESNKLFSNLSSDIRYGDDFESIGTFTPSKYLNLGLTGSDEKLIEIDQITGKNCLYIARTNGALKQLIKMNLVIGKYYEFTKDPSGNYAVAMITSSERNNKFARRLDYSKGKKLSVYGESELSKKGYTVDFYYTEGSDVYACIYNSTGGTTTYFVNLMVQKQANEFKKDSEDVISDSIEDIEISSTGSVYKVTIDLIVKGKKKNLTFNVAKMNYGGD